MRLQLNWTPALKILTSLLLALTLAACGSSSSDGGSRLNPTPGNGDGGGNGGGDGGNGGTPQETIYIGNGTGDSFSQGEIGSLTGSTTLGPGGSTTLQVNFVNDDRVLVTQEVNVTFNSPCIASGESTLGGDATITTTTGQASILYTSLSCVGNDLITATAQINGSSLSAQVTLEIAGADAERITLVEASPALISLKGIGGQEVSRITLQVISANNSPVKGIDVEFSLSTQAGGVSLVNETATSDSNGHVIANIAAGIAATPVNLIAYIPSSGITTQIPSVVTISSGTPEQKSITLAPSVFNPAAWDYNGVPVDVTIYLLDAFNNYVPDGTNVQFTSSGGGIAPNCTTIGGRCTVTWHSQQVRPASGRVQILARTIGNESFINTTEDWWFTPGEDIFVTATETTDPSECLKNSPSPSETRPTAPNEAVCDDLGDPYLDANFNNLRDSDEPFFSLRSESSSGYQEGNGIYNGTLCREEDHASGLCSRELGYIRAVTEIVMSCDTPHLQGNRLEGQEPNITIPTTIEVVLADCNGNALPVGTEVSINLSDTENVKANRTSVTIPSTLRSQTFSIVLSADDGVPSGSISFTIDVATPDGTLTFETDTTVIN